jgi:hypothetical protein
MELAHHYRLRLSPLVASCSGSASLYQFKKVFSTLPFRRIVGPQRRGITGRLGQRSVVVWGRNWAPLCTRTFNYHTYHSAC